MRLIDADALIETVKDVSTYGYVDHGVCSKWDYATWTASEIVKEIEALALYENGLLEGIDDGRRAAQGKNH